jgi:uncharacterized membrane protein YecN with MAPEG domain
MYCDQCGAQLSSGMQFCGSCGKAVGAAAAVPSAAAARVASTGRVQQHIQLLATFWLISGILRMAQVGSILIAGRILPYLTGWRTDRAFASWPFDLLPFGLYSIGAILAIFGIAHIFLAWGLFQRESWARTLGLILGFLALPRIPFGTALGIYTIWVLLPQPSGQEYAQLSHQVQTR